MRLPVPRFLPVMMLVAITTTVDLEGRGLYATAVASALIGTMATGLCCLLIGRFQLARFLRFIPYPVAGGFVAGTGGLACLVGLRLMGFSFEREAVFSVLDSDAAMSLGIGVSFGLGFRSNEDLDELPDLPDQLLGGGDLVPDRADRHRVTVEEARVLGLVFGESSNGGLWPPIGPSDLPHIDWREIAGQLSNLVVLITVTLICLVMNLGGIEVAANVDLDWNREFRASGWANVLTSIGGAPPGCLIASTSIRNVLFGATTRLTGSSDRLLARRRPDSW